MERTAKIFGIAIILVLVSIGVSNDDTVIFRIWPFDFEISMSLGLCLTAIFLFSFLSGGFYMWLQNSLKYRKSLKEANAQARDLEKRIKNIEQ